MNKNVSEKQRHKYSSFENEMFDHLVFATLTILFMFSLMLVINPNIPILLWNWKIFLLSLRRRTRHYWVCVIVRWLYLMINWIWKSKHVAVRNSQLWTRTTERFGISFVQPFKSWERWCGYCNRLSVNCQQRIESKHCDTCYQ